MYIRVESLYAAYKLQINLVWNGLETSKYLLLYFGAYSKQYLFNISIVLLETY